MLLKKGEQFGQVAREQSLRNPFKFIEVPVILQESYANAASDASKGR